MPSLPTPCPCPQIPPRLHWLGRPTQAIGDDDEVYMRHPVSENYGAPGFVIPDYHVLDQSVNSRDLNQGGVIDDVLHNGTTCMCHSDWEIACFKVRDLHQRRIPNENTVFKDDDGSMRYRDTFTFSVEHDPTPCIYPHSCIYILKNGERPRDVPKGVKTAVRSFVAQLAQANREELILRLESQRNRAETTTPEQEITSVSIPPVHESEIVSTPAASPPQTPSVWKWLFCCVCSLIKKLWRLILPH